MWPLSLFAIVVTAVVSIDATRFRASPGPRSQFLRNVQKRTNTRRQGGDAICSSLVAPVVEAPKANPWLALSSEESSSVAEWLHAQPELNLTRLWESGNWDNTLSQLDLHYPSKSDVLEYLDGSGPAPPRYANARITFQASDEPYTQEILVGPLPIRNGTTKSIPLEETWTRKTEGKVPTPNSDWEAEYDWQVEITTSVADITLDLWGLSMTGEENDTIWTQGSDPYIQDRGRRKTWAQLWQSGDEETNSNAPLPLGLFFLSDITGRDPSKWKFEGWYYDGVFYDSTAKFRDAYWGGKVQKLKAGTDGTWFNTDQEGPVPPMDDLRSPTAVAPDGARFKVDVPNKYVEWMDWSFYVGFTTDTALGLFDVRYKGKRIIYEISLQEALAHYAGSDPTMANTAFFDTFYGFGSSSSPLIKGFDCPAYATYLNVTTNFAGFVQEGRDALCLFEHDPAFPMNRHAAWSTYTATKNIEFNIRTVSTVGNYDYMQTFTFMMDGSLACEVRASGEIRATYYAKNEDYGFRIHDGLSGAMHDHVLNYKVDFDILGLNNSIQLMDVVPTTTSYPWSQGKEYNTMKLKRSFISDENEGQFNWKENSQQQVIVVNQDKKNKYGEYPGYRVMPYGGTAHLTVDKSTVVNEAANWATHDIMVSKQKDTEPRSAHPLNNDDSANPPVNFSEFFDGESLDQTDLVMWLNLGMHHVPHTGDLPNTVFTTARSGLIFTPSNYLESGANKESANMIRVEYATDEQTPQPAIVDEVVCFGNASCSLTC